LKKRVSKKYLRSVGGWRNRGFTMAEVIVAIAIMSTSLLAIFGTARSCSMAADRNRKLSQAVLIAETLLNEQMLDEGIAYQSSQGSSDKYDWEIKILETDIENLAKIEIAVTIRQQSSRQEYELVSFLYIEPETVN